MSLKSKSKSLEWKVKKVEKKDQIQSSKIVLKLIILFVYIS